MIAQQLVQDGVCVIPMFDPLVTLAYRNRFIGELNKTPELKNPVFGKSLFVDGGFGALGLASSFHNEVVRDLRCDVYNKMTPIFKELSVKYAKEGHTDHMLEMLFDRFSLRPAGSSTTKESWHRDITPTKLDDDIIFGGWLNLDETSDQYFSCVLQTHMDKPDGSVGFAPIKDKTVLDSLSSKSTIVCIPPGSLVLFYQNILHSVFPLKSKIDSMRQYFGWRLTRSSVGLFATDKWMKDVFGHQGVPPIPSNQKPRMFSKSTINFRKRKLIDWAKSELVEEVTVTKKNKRSGEEETLPKTYCPSLKEANLPLFSAYAKTEQAFYLPSPL